MHQTSQGRERPASDTSWNLPAPPALNPRAHALFLDLDGTIAPIVDKPEDVQLGGEMRDLLTQLAQSMNGAIALVTGRTIQDADQILGGAIANIAGVHGYEIRRGADFKHNPVDLERIADAKREAEFLLCAQAPDAAIEDKRASLALHYRMTPASEHKVRQVAETLAAKHGLRTLQGKMVIELVAGAHSKAHALESYLDAPPFRGRSPIAVGDDLTDEAAFAAANARGGFAVLVGEPRPSAAQHRLSDPDAVAAWLRAALEHTP